MVTHIDPFPPLKPRGVDALPGARGLIVELFLAQAGRTWRFHCCAHGFTDRLSDVDLCQFSTQAAAHRGPVPPTSRQQKLKKA
jgi:hypothetical protein